MKKYNWLLLALAALLLAGCSLARAEAAPGEGGGDRWVGFYVVPSVGSAEKNHVYDNPYAEEYGNFTAETGEFGALSFPRTVLFAVEDEAGNYTFPGIERGYSLFLLRRADENSSYLSVISDMAPGEEATKIAYRDDEEDFALSGAVYFGPPLGAKDWDAYESAIIWIFYRVYETPEGRFYLNGDGDSTDAPMTHTATRTCTRTTNGASVSETIQVTVEIKTSPRLERVVVTQFDAANAILRSDDLNLSGELPEISCQAETAWVLVEEISGEGTTRTLYDLPPAGEEPIAHQIVLLDDQGFGDLTYLYIQQP